MKRDRTDGRKGERKQEGHEGRDREGNEEREREKE